MAGLSMFCSKCQQRHRCCANKQCSRRRLKILRTTQLGQVRTKTHRAGIPAFSMKEVDKGFDTPGGKALVD